ncbi:hypothetical protein AB0395_47370, partial [Streptosporangium sp. NPDC051023]
KRERHPLGRPSTRTGSLRRSPNPVIVSGHSTRGDPRQPPARIAEAEREGWLGEVEGLHIYLTAAEAKFDERARQATTVNLGLPSFRQVAGRTAILPKRRTGGMNLQADNRDALNPSIG